MRMILHRIQRIHHVIFLCLWILLISPPGIGLGMTPSEFPASWKFAVVSDTQGNKSNKSCVNEAVVRAIAADIVREKPDFVLVAGDLVNGWFRNGGVDFAIQYANWKAAMISVYQAGIRVYPIRGNHDSGPERLALPPLPPHLEPAPDAPDRLKKAFREAFAESYIPNNGPADEEGLTYSFVHKNAFIAGLDQFTRGQHRINQDWLNRQLAGIKKIHVFIYGHEPAFETDHKDSLAFYPEARDLLWDRIGRAGARIYFCGHDHFYNRALILDSQGNPIRQIIGGTGGGYLRTWSGAYREGKRARGEYHNGAHHGYILVTVRGADVTVSWKALVKTGATDDWQILDTFAYSIPADGEEGRGHNNRRDAPR